MADVLVACLWYWAERPGAHDWYHTPVKTPYLRESDNSHWTLLYVRAEDVDDDWDTAYISPSTGLLTDTDPGGDSVAVRLKTTKYPSGDNLADQNPTGRVSADGAPIVGSR